MKVSLVTGSLSHRGGGVAFAVQALARNLKSVNTNVRVFGLRDGGWQGDEKEWIDIPTSCLRTVGPGALGYAPDALAELRAFDADIAHTHGIWQHSSRVVTQWAASTRKPYVVSPHGMLDTWALKRSVWKKRIASQLYENDHLRNAKCLHALCDAEARAIRGLGFENPICVIPNGISMPPADDSRAAPWTKFITGDRRVMLFLGRLHPKKNLAALIEAWPAGSVNKSWSLAIAGWDQGGHLDTLRTLVKERGLERHIHFLGPLLGAEKDAALRRADAFVLPSLSEGVPMATLEAWSYGLPVLQTDACNLPEGFEQNAAIRISTVPTTLSRDLEAFMAIPQEALAEIGKNGRRIAQEKFCWRGVAAQFHEVYAWLLGRGKRPTCVQLNDRSAIHAA